MKKILLALLALLISTTTVHADNSFRRGPHVTIETDGSQADGSVNLLTNNAGPINFYINKALVQKVTGTGGYTFYLRGDINRKLAFDAATDTDIVMSFGDGGTTAAQVLSIGGSTADGDDDSAIGISPGGGTGGASRGPTIQLYGNEWASGSIGGFARVVLGGTTSNFQVYGNDANTLLFDLEDNGDTLTLATDLVINATNKGLQILNGATLDADVTTASPTGRTVQYIGSNTAGTNIATIANGANANSNSLYAMKTRAAANSWNANTIIVSGDDIFDIVAYGADGAAFIPAAQMLMESAGTPGTNDMPGQIVFKTTADGAAVLTTALTIGSDQSATFTGAITSSIATSIGWSVVDQTDNQACNTGCTSGCVLGIANATGTAVTNLVSCADTTADLCICAGAS